MGNLKLKSINRTDERETYYYGDCDIIQVEVEGQEKAILASLIDLSVLGAKLASLEFAKSHIGKNIKIYSHSAKTATVGKIVHVSSGRLSGEDTFLAGIKFVAKPNSEIRDKRFSSPKNFETQCHGQHPFRYNQTVYYRVVDFSRRGMGISTKVFTYLLMPGSRLRLHLYLPTYGVYPVDTIVKSTRKADDGKFIIGCMFESMSPRLQMAISSYLLTSESDSPSLTELRESGFLVGGDLSKVVISRYVNSGSREMWQSYLDLRLRAQQGEGRWKGEADPTKTLDPFDPTSRHMLLTLGSSPVGIGRIVFNGGKEEASEHFGKVDIPQWIKDGGFVEASRFATDPGYRKANIFPIIIKNGFKICIQNGLPYVLANCEDSLVPIYQKVGAKLLHQKFNTQFMEEKALNLMYFDVFALCKGKGINPLVWVVIFSDLLPTAEKFNRVELSPARRVYLRCLTKCVSWILRILEERKLRKLSQKINPTAVDYPQAL